MTKSTSIPKAPKLKPQTSNDLPPELDLNELSLGGYQNNCGITGNLPKQDGEENKDHNPDEQKIKRRKSVLETMPLLNNKQELVPSNSVSSSLKGITPLTQDMCNIQITNN